MPSAKSLSSVPEWCKLSKRSPWLMINYLVYPGGYQSALSPTKSVGSGRCESFLILGNLLWLNVCKMRSWFAYFWMILCVSVSVLKEFIKINGTWTSFCLFRYYCVSTDETSICRTIKSRKVIPSLTSIPDFGPTHPANYWYQYTHCCSQTSIQFQNGQFPQIDLFLFQGWFLKRRIHRNRVLGWGFHHFRQSFTLLSQSSFWPRAFSFKYLIQLEIDLMDSRVRVLRDCTKTHLEKSSWKLAISPAKAFLSFSPFTVAISFSSSSLTAKAVLADVDSWKPSNESKASKSSPKPYMISYDPMRPSSCLPIDRDRWAWQAWLDLDLPFL